MAQWKQSVTFYGKLMKLWYWIAVFALNGPVWPCHVWSFFGNRHVWPYVVLHGLFMALYGLLWQNIVFSRCHRTKFICSCILLLRVFYLLSVIKWIFCHDLSLKLFEVKKSFDTFFRQFSGSYGQNCRQGWMNWRKTINGKVWP